MNIETANKLVDLRKKNNFSQEELANKLGISRQAVSKWERAEAAPDTDNLVKLARLYKISLDDLLLSDIDLMNEIDKEIENPELINSGNLEDEYDEEIKISKGKKIISIRQKGGSRIIFIRRTAYIIVSSLCTIGFFLVGFLTRKWELAVLFFLAVPLFNAIISAIQIKKVEKIKEKNT